MINILTRYETATGVTGTSKTTSVFKGKVQIGSIQLATSRSYSAGTCRAHFYLAEPYMVWFDTEDNCKTWLEGRWNDLLERSGVSKQYDSVKDELAMNIAGADY